MTAATAPTRPQTAAEVCRRYQPSKDVRALLRKDQSSKALFDLLVRDQLYADAVSFLARLLSKQEAIWWGCLCAWDAARPNPSPATQAALQASLRWLQEPTEEHRRAAETVAQKAGFETPAGAVAQAVAFAAGSMTATGLPEVAAPEDLTAQTIAAAIRGCSAQLLSAEVDEPYPQLLRLGLEVASGKNQWV